MDFNFHNYKALKEIKAYWYVSDNKEHAQNWGDCVNQYIIAKMAGVELDQVVNDSDSDQTLKAIGSILHRDLKSGDVLWGTGSIHNSDLPKDLNLNIRAVRGPLTRDLIIKNGYYCPEVYGDPALLMPDFYNPEVEKTNKVGIIPHVTEIDRPEVKSILERHPTLKLIDIRLGHEEFIDELKSVEYVLSSSLHGLIAADAYRIPNAKIDIPGPGYKGDNWKYYDYFASVGRFVTMGHRINMTTNLQDLTDAAHWNFKFGRLDLEPLRKAFPKFV